MDRAAAKVIGHYAVVHSLEAGGGMGRHAHLALRRDPPGSSQLYVLKEIEPRDVPLREAERYLDAVGILRHRAQLSVVERFEHDGRLVVVFEHHDGLRLDQIQDHLEREGERLADKAIAHIGYELAGALAEAHEARTHTGRLMRMLHGHLAPDMIHIGWDGEIRVLGTGLTPLFGGAERNEAALAYRSPELRSGSRPSAFGDVHAVATILWCLFTGRRPPPEGRGFTKLGYLRKDVPSELADALELALNPNPASRTITCRDLEGTIEQAYPGADQRGELRWNLELFRALSLLSWSLPPNAPPTQTRLDVGRVPRPISLVPPPPTSRGAPSSLEPVTQPHPTLPRPATPRETLDAEPPTQKDGTRSVGDRTLVAEGVDAAPPSAGLDATRVMAEHEIEQGEASTRVSRREASPPKIDAVHAQAEPTPMPTVMLDASPIPPLPATPGHAHGEPTPSPTPPPLPAPAPTPAVAEASRAAVASAGHAWPTTAEPQPVHASATSRSGKSLWVMGILALMLVFAGVLTALALRLRPPPEAQPPAATPAVAETARSPSGVAASGAGAGKAAAEASGVEGAADPSAQPSASAAASAEPSAAASAEPPAYTDDGRDGSKLLSYLGYLVVRSTADADVYVQGVRLGTTNEKLEARCWTRNVRLREKNDGAWLTAGAPVKITCMDTTLVRMEP